MINYSNDNTIAVLVKDKKLLAALKSVCEKQKVLVYSIKKHTDIIAVPCFMTIIEKKLLEAQHIEILEELLPDIGDNEWQLYLIGSEKIELSRQLKKQTITIDTYPTNQDLEEIIIEQKESLIKKVKRMEKINNRVYRIIKLYIDVTNNGNLLNIEEYTALNVISERTLRRDIRVLKDLFPDFNVYFKDKWKL